MNSKITLIHVTPAASGLKNLVQVELNKRIQARAMIQLIQFAKQQFKGKIPDYVELRVEVGQHIPTIIEVANKEFFNLVIIRKNKRVDGLIDKLKKQSADKLIQNINCLVLSVKDRWNYRGVDHILVPIDIRQQSRDLLHWCIYLGKKLNSRITLIAVLNLKIELEHSLAYKKAKLLERSISNEGILCNVEMIENKEEQKIESLLQYSKQKKADLMLVQVTQDALFGDSQSESFTSRLLDDSVKPILSLKSSKVDFIKDILITNSVVRVNLSKEKLACE